MTVDTTALAPCLFRRVARGQTSCTRALDEFDQTVWPEVCGRCPVPAWLAAGVCKHLDIGTEVARNLGAESPRIFTACRFFGLRLEGLGRCRTCPEFARWDVQAEAGVPLDQIAAGSIPGDVLEEAMRQALERHVEKERVRLMPSCFRAAATQCLRAPQFAVNRVVVVPPPALRSNDGYLGLIAEVLKSGGMEGLLFNSPLRDIDTLCDLCLAIQQSARLVVDIGEWDTAALFSLGLAGGLGRPTLMIRGRDATPPFVPQGLPSFEYSTGDELAALLVQGLQLQIQAPAEGQAAGEGEAAPEAGAAAPAEASTPTPGKIKRKKSAKGTP